MRFTYTIVTLICLVAAFAHAQGGVDWPDQVELGQLLILDAPEGATCTWGVTGADVDGDVYNPVFREFPGAMAIETRYVGELTIDLQTSAKRGLKQVTWTILVGSDTPDPPDPPDPPPPPSMKIFAVMVEESGDRGKYTAEQINAITAEEDTAYMKAKGFLYSKVDQDVVEPDGQGGDRVPLDIASFLQRAKGQILPRLIIANELGTVLYDAIVVDGSSVLSILKQYGGE